MPKVNNTLEQLTAAKEDEKEHDGHKIFPLPPLQKEKGSRKRKTTGKKICSADECNNLAVKNGVCWRHGAKDLVEQSAKKKKTEEERMERRRRKRKEEAGEKLFYKTGTCTREGGTTRATSQWQMRRARTLGKTGIRLLGTAPKYSKVKGDRTLG